MNYSGSELRRRRRRLGLTLSDLAILAECGTATIEKYEGGRYNLTPSIEQVFAKIREIEEDKAEPVTFEEFKRHFRDHYDSLSRAEKVELMNEVSLAHRELDVN